MLHACKNKSSIMLTVFPCALVLGMLVFRWTIIRKCMRKLLQGDKRVRTTDGFSIVTTLPLR